MKLNMNVARITEREREREREREKEQATVHYFFHPSLKNMVKMMSQIYFGADD